MGFFLFLFPPSDNHSNSFQVARRLTLPYSIMEGLLVIQTVIIKIGLLANAFSATRVSKGFLTAVIQRCLSAEERLFASQRNHGIDAHRAPCRDIAGSERN